MHIPHPACAHLEQLVCSLPSRVYGNSYENVLVAVVVPDKKALTAWASDNGLSDASFEELCDNSKVRR
jgi:long-subunit acyl-CoA synthetase (AMP-forming)